MDKLYDVQREFYEHIGFVGEDKKEEEVNMREIGDTVYLKVPYRGYRRGEIVEINDTYYVVRFSSGMEEGFREDEFED